MIDTIIYAEVPHEVAMEASGDTSDQSPFKENKIAGVLVLVKNKIAGVIRWLRSTQASGQSSPKKNIVGAEELLRRTGGSAGDQSPFKENKIVGVIAGGGMIVCPPRLFLEGKGGIAPAAPALSTKESRHKHTYWILERLGRPNSSEPPAKSYGEI
ncbi:unnamed protein product [Bursaphelenchus xylophilus]|uniref:(pine wood nematode) hypothetical protein n=1 Tax=Bursaphelenchus xylophilus TaxID=6326 RepID=A0A1I7SRP8_BURXY|nr:unnamed protein product [Bursaphelenchus xylophilus]CAG9102020.1 unnamed protein product [Bursaphelenchus xylophilus]